MAFSRRERNPGDVDLSGSSISTTPATAGNTVIDTDERTDTPPVIPAGKLKVQIYNLGFVLAGDEEEPITVNGDELQPNSPPMIFEAKYDHVSNVFKYTPAITIVNSNGARIRIITEE